MVEYRWVCSKGILVFLLFLTPNFRSSPKAELTNKFSSGLSKAQSENSGFRFDVVSTQVNRDDEVASFNSTCDVGSSQSFSAIVDMVIFKFLVYFNK